MQAILSMTTVEEVKQLEVFRSYISPQLLKNITTMVQQKEIHLEFSHLDFEKDEWDGEVRVVFKEAPTAKRVINAIVQYAHADEVSMQDEKTLRLWWD